MTILTSRRSLMAGLALVGVSSPASAQSTSITGAGATFPRPLYERWAQQAKDTIGVNLNYQSIGSGGGINQIAARTVDFGASDAPLSNDRLIERNLMQFPTVMGSVILSVNLPGIDANTLVLTPDIIVGIFSGQITRWNDTRIASINPSIRLPSIPVSPCYRADGSGTTWVFTTYMSRVSDEWKNGPGLGTSINWPKGNGARGNEGVSNMIRNTPGTIGYIEYAYAVVNRLPATQLVNKSGKVVRPSADAFNATAALADWTVPNFAADTINLSGDTVWPITSPTYILLPMNPTNDRVNASRDVLRFFDWAFRHGSTAASRLGYITLPDSVHQSIRNEWKVKIKSPSGAEIWTG